jgi:L-asparagine oxygenase
MTPDAEDAFRALSSCVESQLEVAEQRVGRLLLIPNRYTVHAREKFDARYDGTDRWLFRAMIHTREIETVESSTIPPHPSMKTI